jgi:hypothetical protein
MKSNCDSKLFSASQQFELGCNIVEDGASSYISSIYESLTSSLVWSLTASPTTSATSENESVQTQSESASGFYIDYWKRCHEYWSSFFV